MPGHRMGDKSVIMTVAGRAAPQDRDLGRRLARDRLLYAGLAGIGAVAG